MENVCLFGGSFDPVHLGHLLVARAAYEELPADQVVFIPAAQSPFKPCRAPVRAETRLQLLRIALAGKPWCQIDEVETKRGGISYTIDTVRAFVKRYPGAKIFYLIGADNVAQLGQWREAQELARLAEFVVIPRPGVGPGPVPEGFRVRSLKGFPLEISSSEIRERIRAGLTSDDLTPPGVAETIRNNGLYL